VHSAADARKTAASSRPTAQLDLNGTTQTDVQTMACAAPRAPQALPFILLSVIRVPPCPLPGRRSYDGLHRAAKNSECGHRSKKMRFELPSSG
jgi:hypothetical protein